MNNGKSLRDIIKDSYSIFAQNKLKFLWLTLLCYLPVQIVNSLVNWKLETDENLNKLIDNLQSLNVTESTTTEELSGMMDQTMDVYSRLLPYYAILLLLSILSFVFIIAVAKIARDESTFLDYKENATALDYMSYGIKKLPMFFVTYVCYMLLIMAGFIFFFVPGVIFLCAISMAVPLLVYSDKTCFKSAFASVRLLFKKPGIFFCFLICSIISMLFTACVTSAFDLINLSGVYSYILDAIVGTACTYFLITVQIVPYVLYLNRVEE